MTNNKEEKCEGCKMGLGYMHGEHYDDFAKRLPECNALEKYETPFDIPGHNLECSQKGGDCICSAPKGDWKQKESEAFDEWLNEDQDYCDCGNRGAGSVEKYWLSRIESLLASQRAELAEEIWRKWISTDIRSDVEATGFQDFLALLRAPNE